MVSAIIAHIAPCVYCPPFSLVPGKYDFIYPGSNLLFSNGGSSNLIIPFSLSIKCFSKLSIEIYFLSLSPALEIVAQLCAILSILHSSFCKLPSIFPSSINALLYHLPSHPAVFNAFFKSCIIFSYFIALSSSPRFLQIGIQFASILYIKNPSQILSPLPLFPTVLNPSFQSPEPILGSPFSPKLIAFCIALWQ